MSKSKVNSASPFAALDSIKADLQKKTAQAEAEKARQAEAAAKAALAKAESERLFQSAFAGVKPLTQERVPEGLKPPRSKKTENITTLARRAAAIGTEGSSITGISDTQALLNPIASEATLSYRQSTLQLSVFDQLKAGNLRWLHAVDLHGCTTEQARAAVLEIIRMAQSDPEARHPLVIKIVHGKGIEATLKTFVNSWLRQHPEVMGFVSAPINQGGTGAVLVLLKRGSSQTE